MKKIILPLSLIAYTVLAAQEQTHIDIVEKLQQEANHLMGQYKADCQLSPKDKTICFPRETSKLTVYDCKKIRKDLDQTVYALAYAIGMNVDSTLSQEEHLKYHAILKEAYTTNCYSIAYEDHYGKHYEFISKADSPLSNETCHTVAGALNTVSAWMKQA